MSNNIAGKVIVITGASSGLGEASARLLAPDSLINSGHSELHRGFRDPIVSSQQIYQRS